MADDAGQPGKREGRKLSLESRIALIGVAGALAGTLVGGLVTWKITQDQISSQKTEAHRTERLDAYTQYFGDAARFWTQVDLLTNVTPPPTALTAAQATALTALQATLTQDYARVALVAPESVHRAAQSLNAVTTEAGNALEGDTIDAKGYAQASAQIFGPKNDLLRRFTAAARADLDSPN
jgi:hypothetical protein